MNFSRNNLWLWVLGALLATLTLTPSTVEAQRHHRRRPAATLVADPVPPAPNPLPRSGPACQTLAANTVEGMDMASVIAAALAEARNRTDDACLALVASRQVSLGQCELAQSTIQEAIGRSPSASFVRCVNALVQACNLSAHPPQDGQLPVCGAEVDATITTLATACVSVAFTDATAPGSIVNALQSLSRTCRDEGTVAGEIAGAVANHWSGTGAHQLNSAPEYGLIREENPQGGLSDATELVRTMNWLQSGANFVPGVTPNVRLMLIDYLDREARSLGTEELHMSNWNRVAALGILTATIRMIQDSPGAFGQALDDLLYLHRRGLLFDERVMTTATNIPIDQGARARLSRADVDRVERAYQMLGRSRLGSAALLRLRIGGALRAYQRPAQDDGLSTACREVARHEENVRAFIGAELSTVPRRAYQGDLRFELAEMDRANRTCEIPNPARERWIESLRTAVDNGGPLTGGSTINFDMGGTP